MRRNRIIKCTFGISLVAFAGGGVSAEASDKIPRGIADYLKEVIAPEAEEASRQGDSWEWEQTGKGGYLTRYYSDVNGDGKPEFFLTTSLAEDGSEWKVFQVDEVGGFHPYVETVVFGNGWIGTYQAKPNSLLVLHLPPREEQREAEEHWEYPLARFEFQYPNVLKSSARVDASEVEKIRAGTTPLESKAEFVLLADYLNDPGIPWRTDGNWQGREHSIEVSDIDRIASNTGFTPQKALALLEKNMERRAQAERSNTSTTKISRSERRSSILEGKNSEEEEKMMPVWPWIVGGITAFFALWRLLIGRRKLV